jgi:hypothetical protein
MPVEHCADPSVVLDIFMAGVAVLPRAFSIHPVSKRAIQPKNQAIDAQHMHSHGSAHLDGEVARVLRHRHAPGSLLGLLAAARRHRRRTAQTRGQ